MRPRTILTIASEAVPFGKTGGLGDVAGALPRALARLGHDVTLVVPRFRGVEGGSAAGRLALRLSGRTFDVTFVEHRLADRARAVLVECPELFDRPALYGVGNNDYSDNAVRFAVLARAALEFAATGDRPPDVVHAHDWQAGLAPVYLRTRYADHPALRQAAAVFTIHNLAYQGLFPAAWMPALGLGWELFGIDGLEFWGKLSFLKGGINYSDLITTVSPRYAKEIQTAEQGSGFDGILRRRSRHLSGLLNGIDAEAWNPETDPFLPRTYGPDSLAGKQVSRRALRDTCGLPVTPAALARPLIGMVSRMVDQKGFDLLEQAADRLLSLDAMFVLLGSGERRYEDLWRTLAARCPDRLAVRIGFNDALAHLVEAGADIFLMPSRFEPCGLNQMYSLRYGTVPVVRATGGLDDTIENWSRRTGLGTGFTFRAYTAQALLGALSRALALFREPDAWRALQLAGMAKDHSWDASAAAYVAVYERAIALRRRQG